MLEQIELCDALITIDAMRCQKEIVEQIVPGSDGVLAVKIATEPRYMITPCPVA